jgi:SAM-dependent methyltransferase
MPNVSITATAGWHGAGSHKGVKHMDDFYGEVIDQLLRTGILSREMKILVVCGGQRDEKVLCDKKFRDVVISNLAAPSGDKDFSPFVWSHQDAERLTFADGSFDFCLVHSGLHHCRSPHLALLEMYRVARRGLLLFEPYDNLVTRIGVRLNIGQAYEHASVVGNKFEHGGVGNSRVPNYVYRWTEREIVKTISSYAPEAGTDIRFVHRMRVPWGQLRHRTNGALYSLVRFAQPALKALELCLPSQTNSFAAIVLKPELPRSLHPWLRQDGDTLRLDEQWLAARFREPSRR